MSAVLDIWDFLGPGGTFHSNLYSYGWGVPDSIFGRYSSHYAPNQFHVTRGRDRKSAGLFEMAATGESIGLMKVTMTYTDDDGRPAKGGVIFSDSVISSISSTGGGKPVESITFTFASCSY